MRHGAHTEYAEKKRAALCDFGAPAGRAPSSLWNVVLCWVSVLFLIAPAAAQAWWNADWGERLKVTFNTGASGIPLKEAVASAVIPLRLHTGNFQFADTKPD